MPADPRVTDAVALCAAGAISAPVALARMVLSGLSTDAIAARVAGVPALASVVAERRAALDDLARMIDESGVDHDGHDAPPERAVARIAALFDRAVAQSPAGSVAAYSLGDPDLLEHATRELMAWLDGEELLGPGVDALDLGCGIGRVAAALSPRVRSVAAIDVSPAMVAAAQARHGALPNTRFAVTSGLALEAQPDAAFDLVLAIDSFPYLVQAGAAVAERHVADAARVLRPGGALVVANWSYRDDAEADADEARRWAAAHGFVLVHAGVRPFALWDGAMFLLRRDDPWRAAMRSGDIPAAHDVSDAVLAARDPATRDDARVPFHLRWVWDGRTLDGCDVLVRCYHGLGDTIMFSRYLPALSRRAAGVTVEAPVALVPLLRAMPGAGQVIAFDPTLPLPPRERDVEIMELGHALRADAEWSEPYLAAEPLADVPRGAVGLCWQAGHWDPRRSVPEQALRAATAAARCVAIPRPDDGAHADATMTARLLASLDLVVTVDTMIAHLAGALGRTTWLLLRAEADWRWMRGDTSPWYPRMRIFRQRTEGDWSAPLAAVAEALRRRAAG